MTQVVTVPTSQLERIERRLDRLEKVLKRLLGVVEHQKNDPQDIFDELFQSQAFENYAQQVLTEFQTDRSEFVDPFSTYRSQRPQFTKYLATPGASKKTFILRLIG